MNISAFERDYLRDLAAQFKEASQTKENLAKRQGWYDINNLKKGARPLFISHYWPVAMNEIFPKGTYKCTSEDALYFERYFLTKLFYVNTLKDDNVVEPVVYAKMPHWMEDYSKMKREVRRTKEDDGSGAFEMIPQIHEEEDINLISEPILHYNKEEAYADFMETKELFDGVLTTIKRPVYFAAKISDEYSWYRGMENTYMDIYDDPDWMKDALQRIADNFEQRFDLLENAGLWGCLDGSDPLGSAGLRYADGINDWRDVKDGDYFNHNLKTNTDWGFSCSEVFTCVSNDTHKEFSMDFDVKAMERFKFCNVGCCEVLDKKIDLVKPFKNCRKVSVSEWCDYETAAAAIKRDYVYSYRAAGTVFLKDHLDREATEKEIRGVLEASKKHDCCTEIVLNIGGCFGANPLEKAVEWSKYTRELIDEYYDKI